MLLILRPKAVIAEAPESTLSVVTCNAATPATVTCNTATLSVIN